MLTQTSTQAQHFKFADLLPGLVICEATPDIHGWNNATANTPAFLVYLGYNVPSERDEWITKLRLVWKIESEILDRPSQRVKGYWHEIKIRGMKRYSDPNVFDLDYLSESQYYGLDFLTQLLQMKQEFDAYEDAIDTRILTS
ncbi:hypothetical protein [Chamaesiphon minutus]|uniref:Uncharacterized protein n=1 Tax=Chamaesiphon minutus (strain ATCC 27169 / PCC 6605) TaxID=1173020 RepID=K9UFH3_CHAP6|nr:hypothetical protein [Chamaesiphon minutus]AFY93176.1 hypothetical protein Cha6605_2082 [Chamaesiphon minutus PCC 6605]